MLYVNGVPSEELGIFGTIHKDQFGIELYPTAFSRYPCVFCIDGVAPDKVNRMHMGPRSCDAEEQSGQITFL